VAATPYFQRLHLDKIIFSKTKKTIYMSFISFTALQIIKTDYLTKTKNQHQKDMTMISLTANTKC
jgi:hypothetical protein